MMRISWLMTLLVLAAFERSRVPSLVIKGTALAYSVYADPALRVRGDTDLLVRPEARSSAQQALLNCGFTPLEAMAGDGASFREILTHYFPNTIVSE